MEIVFYALSNTPLERALPKFLSKIYSSGFKCHLLCADEDQLRLLDKSLWTYSTLAFLPHGTKFMPTQFHDKNPIWLSESLDFVNNPDALIYLKPLSHKDNTFKKIIYFYDQNKSDEQQYQKLYNDYIAQNKSPLLWKQTREGGWEKSQ